VLILQSFSTESIQVDSWGQLHLREGYYLYVGSAFGPGGVQTRVGRHFRTGKRKHWHVDYLRERVTPLEAWASYESKHLEHEWAQALSKMDEIIAIQGFGCSDCKCYSHLFHSSTKLNLAIFSSTIGITPVLYLA
jgi:Uri superfamily endonuclease